MELYLPDIAHSYHPVSHTHTSTHTHTAYISPPCRSRHVQSNLRLVKDKPVDSPNGPFTLRHDHSARMALRRQGVRSDVAFLLAISDACVGALSGSMQPPCSKSPMGNLRSTCAMCSALFMHCVYTAADEFSSSHDSALALTNERDARSTI